MGGGVGDAGEEREGSRREAEGKEKGEAEGKWKGRRREGRRNRGKFRIIFCNRNRT